MTERELSIPDSDQSDSITPQHTLRIINPGVLYPSITSDYILNHDIDAVGVSKKDRCAEDIQEAITDDIILRIGVDSSIYYEDMPHE